MGVNKRFYWLKLPEDFYSDKAIKLLSKYEKGSTYIGIYLKMLLKSLKDNGKLYFEGIVTNIAEEIALDIDESTEDVQTTLDFLKERDMAVITDTSIELTRINEMIGSETNKAEKMRRLRKEQNSNKVTPKGNNVTPNGNNVTPKGNIVQNRYPILEKDIDIEKDIDTDIKEKNTKKETNKKQTDKEVIDSILESVVSEELKNALIEYVEMRKKIKKQITGYGFKLAYNKLQKLSSNLDEQIEIVNRSVMNSWQTFYPLETTNKKKQNQEWWF